MSEAADRELFQRLLSLARELLAELEHEYDRVLNEAVRDPLTGIHNRRLFQQRLAQELSRARRYQHCLTLIMLDIDHFKRYNDAHGHRAGDEILRRLALVVQQELREPDMFFRIGGEEFAVLLPETNLQGAAVLVDRLRCRIAEDSALPITLSYGLAEFPAHADSPDTLIEAADQALYVSKKAGRDLAYAADGLPVTAEIAAASEPRAGVGPESIGAIAKSPTGPMDTEQRAGLQPVEVGFHLDDNLPASIWADNRIIRVRDAVIVQPVSDTIEAAFHVGTDVGDLRLLRMQGRWYMEG